MVVMLLTLSFLAGAQEAPQPVPQEPEAQGAQQARTPGPKSQLARAARDGQVEEVRALLMAGGNPNLAFTTAVLFGQADIVKMAIEFGAKLTGDRDPGVQALRTALSFSDKSTQQMLKSKPGNGYDEIIAILLDHGVPADSTDDLGMPLLITASLAGNAKAAQLLLDHGAKPDKGPQSGGTPLACAALYGHGTIVELLLKAGASVNLRDESEQVPLSLAACAGSHESWALLEGRAVSDFSWDKGRHGKDYSLAVKALIKANADVNATAKNGVTALMAASRAGDLAIVKELLDAGAALHDADDKGRTALMAAVSSGAVPLVQLLLERGADPKAVALDGTTALSLAKRGKSPEMVRLIGQALEKKPASSTRIEVPDTASAP